MELDKIYYMDCLDGLKELDNNSIDLVFTDPPYNIGRDYNNHNDAMPINKYYLWCEKWLYECVRVLKDTGSLFVMNYPEHLSHFKIYLENYMGFVNWITWIRNDNQFYNKDKQFKRNHQDILFLVKDKQKYYFDWRAVARKPIWSEDKRVKDLAGQTDTWSDITYVKGNMKEKTDADNQLPIKLVRRIISCTTNNGYVVLDPFMGSGTTAVACKQLNRHFIGFELNQEYVDIANKRLEQSTIMRYV